MLDAIIAVVQVRLMMLLVQFAGEMDRYLKYVLAVMVMEDGIAEDATAPDRKLVHCAEVMVLKNGNTLAVIVDKPGK